jgi:hypothetical protein
MASASSFESRNVVTSKHGQQREEYINRLANKYELSDTESFRFLAELAYRYSFSRTELISVSWEFVSGVLNRRRTRQCT